MPFNVGGNFEFSQIIQINDVILWFLWFWRKQKCWHDGIWAGCSIAVGTCVRYLWFKLQYIFRFLHIILWLPIKRYSHPSPILVYTFLIGPFPVFVSMILCTTSGFSWNHLLFARKMAGLFAMHLLSSEIRKRFVSEAPGLIARRGLSGWFEFNILHSGKLT